jgi:hypothetical protein
MASPKSIPRSWGLSKEYLMTAYYPPTHIGSYKEQGKLPPRKECPEQVY